MLRRNITKKCGEETVWRGWRTREGKETALEVVRIKCDSEQREREAGQRELTLIWFLASAEEDFRPGVAHLWPYIKCFSQVGLQMWKKLCNLSHLVQRESQRWRRCEPWNSERRSDIQHNLHTSVITPLHSYLSVYPYIHPIHPSSMRTSIYPSIFLFIHPYTYNYSSIHQSILLFIHLYIHPFILQSINISVNKSIHPSIVIHP